ncbi:hypothetical protein GCM10007906_40490 [Vibrio hyugaensis]|uniref:Uncharacterized protein n=1 Tax=Vibrio hyugaensis TaxID=1534743 RepID=A0ABQ5YAL5_9VIBR|nr:hypothetical protein GCM10007906_40490 [Vibrio hyugaensis]
MSKTILSYGVYRRSINDVDTIMHVTKTKDIGDQHFQYLLWKHDTDTSPLLLSKEENQGLIIGECPLSKR